MNPVLSLLLGDYRPRPLAPRLRSCVARRVVTYWLLADDPWPEFAAADLVVVQGVALRPSDIDLWKRRQSELPALAHVLVGLPVFLLPGPTQGDDPLTPGRAVQPAPRPVLRDYFQLSNFHWFLAGIPHALNLAERRARKSVLGELLSSLYHGAPTHLGGGKAGWQDAVAALVCNKGRLKVSTADLNNKSAKGFYKILGKFFLRSGILAAADSGLGWTELRVSGLAQGWLAFLLESLYGQGAAQGTEIDELMRALVRPPFGARGELAVHLVAIAASCHIGSLWHETSSESARIEPAHLLPILRKREGRLVFRPASSAEQLFLRSLRQLFRPLVESRGDLALDPWDQTRKDLLHWYAELPGWTRQHRLSYSPQAQALLRVCQEAAVGESRKLLGENLPEAFRWKSIPQPGEQAYLIDQINVARLELEGFLRGFLDKLTMGIHSALTGSAPGDLATSREWLLRGRKAWLGGFLSGSFEGVAFSPWAEGLLAALSGPSGSTHGEGGSADFELEERWFVQLPRDFGLTPVHEWETDHTRLFLARLGRARLELELGRFQEDFAGFSGPRRAEAARSWLHSVLTGDDVPAEVAEEILALVLDDLE